MNSKLRLVLLAGCFATISSFPAYAGFQWTAPSAQPTTTGALGNEVYVPRVRGPQAMTAPMAAPVAPVMSENLPQSMNQIAPVATIPDGPASAAPIYGNGMSDDPVSWNQPQGRSAQAAPRAPQNITPAASMPLYAPAVAAPAPVVMQAPMGAVGMGNGMYQIADGFGADLPLVMALRQIVPPQYGFSFDAGVNVSQQVSWQGGKPWDIVLQETVAPHGLTATIRGNVVSITRTGVPVSMQPVAMSGPQVVTETIQTANTMPMPVSPILQTSAPAAPMMATPAVMTPAAMPAVIAPAAASTDAAELGTAGTWTAPRNSSLRSILEDWSKRVNVELYWASEYDYPIQSAVAINGTFEEAVQVLLRGLTDSKPRPMGRLHPNLPNGPAVLVIETRQNSM